MLQSKVSVELGTTKSVKGEWENFRSKIFKNLNPSETQINETRKAFYSGFYSCLAMMYFGTSEMSEDQGAEWLESLKDECDNFFKSELKNYLESKN